MTKESVVRVYYL